MTGNPNTGGSWTCLALELAGEGNAGHQSVYCVGQTTNAGEGYACRQSVYCVGQTTTHAQL